MIHKAIRFFYTCTEPPSNHIAHERIVVGTIAETLLTESYQLINNDNNGVLP